MSDLDQLFASLPIDQIAQQLGADPTQVQRAAAAALPALLSGMQANAQDPGGEASLLSALTQHETGLADGQVDVSRVDIADGEKIARHVFGDNEDQVVAALGNTGVSGSLIKKLLPILAPIVMAFLAKQLSAKGGAGAGAGVLGSILSTILAGAASGMGGTSGSGMGGSILGDVLGQVLGGGSSAAASGAPSGSAGSSSPLGPLGDILGDLLGGGRKS